MPTYTLIEDFSADDRTVMVDERTLPVPSLVEDPDGIRALLMPAHTSIPIGIWVQAHAGGAAFIVLVGPGKDDYAWMTTEDFIEQRIEDARHQTVMAATGWDIWEGPAPSYRNLIEAAVASQVERERPAPASAGGQDEDLGTFVHLHTHSEYSALDGLSKVSEMVAAVVADGQKALAVADHGFCTVHPELQAECEKAGLKAIFGMEAYFVPDRHRRMREWFETPEDCKTYTPGLAVDPTKVDDETRKVLVRKTDAKDALNEYTHITLWAMDDAGLRNLWAMSTESHLEGFYGKPRLDWDTLERLNAGVMASTGCLRGPVSQALLAGDKNKAEEMLLRMLGIFGDRLVIEIHTNHLPEQIKVNHDLVAMAGRYNVPMIAAVDSHYATKEDAPVHRAWLAAQTDKDLADDSSLFAGGQDYHMASLAEVVAALDYLAPEVVLECIENTVHVARRCTAKVYGATSTPTYSNASPEHPDPVARDMERLLDICLANWDRKVKGKRYSEEVYAARFEREMALLISKQFCGYFLVVWDYCFAAKHRPVEEGGPILVGPGRGSGGGSLVAYLADIVEIDPVDANLLFERFLTEGRTSLPDFDIDFPAGERGWLKRYVSNRWGEDHVVTIGTVVRLQNKGAYNDACRVLLPHLDYDIPYMESEALKKLITAADAGLAGKHLPWDEFCAQFADVVDPMRARYPEVFAHADRTVTRIKSYGKHPAGVVISTDPAHPLTSLPLRLDKDGNTVTQFEQEALESLGYVKFDLLTLRTLDTIQHTLNLIRERFGVEVPVYDWKEEYDDPQVWDAVSAGQTLGLFQVETPGGTRMCRRYQPHSLHDLAAVVTLVRPGPMRSGLTETYLKRRSGLEQVTFPEPRLETVLGGTYGCIIYQEDVMQTTMALAGYSSNEADVVRKILGKKQVEKVVAAGREFTSRAVANNTDEQVASVLWEQMAEFAKYSFNKAHAFGYAVLGYWTAWLKFHYPVQFLTAALATVDDDRIPEFVNEARKMGYTILGPDVNESGVSFVPSQMTVRYGLSSVKGIGVPTAAQIVEGAPYTSVEDFVTRMVEPKGSKVNKGHLAILVSVGAFDTMIPNRRALEMQLTAESSGEATRCAHKVEDPQAFSFTDPKTNVLSFLPCSFDWPNEPNPPVTMTGRGKNKVATAKPPPKRCTTACRNYTKPDSIGPADVQPYGEADIRDREMELLGVWLSSTPFDRLDDLTRDLCSTAEEVEGGPNSLSEGYLVAALVGSVREATDRNGGKYARITLVTESGVIEPICFSSVYPKVRECLRKDALVLCNVWKDDRGLKLIHLIPA